MSGWEMFDGELFQLQSDTNPGSRSEKKENNFSLIRNTFSFCSLCDTQGLPNRTLNQIHYDKYL